MASHRKNRDGGGVIIYIDNNATYKPLISISDEMCSIVAIYLEDLNFIVFMIYRPPPNNKSTYQGEKLEKSFNDIVTSNINKVIGKFQAPTPDILLAGNFNFPKALWDAGMGIVQTDNTCNRKSLQQLIDVASSHNILELIFTNNHELITNMQIQPSEITDHKYIKY